MVMMGRMRMKMAMAMRMGKGLGNVVVAHVKTLPKTISDQIN